MDTIESNVYSDEYLDLNKYWLVLKRRWLPATITAVSIIGLSLGYAFSLDQEYESSATLLIKTDKKGNLTGIENDTGKIEVISDNSDPLATEAEILRSRPIVEQIITELDLRDDEGELLKYRDFVESLRVKAITGTDILEITYKSSEPELTALVVNQALRLYQSQDTLSNRTEAASAKNFITEQLPQIKANVKQAEAELRQFKNRYQIANLSEETTATIGNLNALKNQINDLKAELEDINARYYNLNSQLGITWQEASAISALSQSVAIQSTFERLQQVKVDLVQKRNYLSENSPQIISLREEAADLERLVDREIEQNLGSQQKALIKNVNILASGELDKGKVVEFADLGLKREGLRKRLVALEKTYRSNQQRSNLFPELEEQQKELERQVEASQSTYKILLNKLQETKIAEEQDIGNVRIISEAVVPDYPIGPKKKMILAAGGVLGTLFGIAVAFLLDIRDNTIKNTQELEAMLPYTLQGVIPQVRSISQGREDRLYGQLHDRVLPATTNDLSLVATREAYQNIQVNIDHLDCFDEIATIAITSAVAQEGKSSVSANYAVTQAKSGKRILLIDSDLRRPTQHNLWQLPNQVGLSNVLEQEVEWYDAVHNVMPNLDVLTAGTKPDNPVYLLNSLLMGILVMKMLKSYDLIIFDTPPLVGLADAKIIGKITDGLLFVVRPGVANYGSITAAKKILATAELNVLGIIANGVNVDKEPYGYEYYYPDRKYLEAASSRSSSSD